MDLSRLADGRNRFEVRALDRAGWTTRDGESWESYVDHTPPPSPSGLAVISASEDSLSIKWDRVPDGPNGSGIARYECQVRIEGQPSGQWINTTGPYATLSGLPANARVNLLARAIDDAGTPAARAAWPPARLPASRASPVPPLPAS